MNDLGRFLAVAAFQEPDYIPIFGFPGAPGMSRGCMKTTHDRLVATGMPPTVGGVGAPGSRDTVDRWKRYWGTTDPVTLDFSPHGGQVGFRTTTRREGGFDIIESESGAVTRQVIDNSQTYSMPEFISFPVRDRDSWEFYKQRMTPRKTMSEDDIEMACRRFDNRDRPLVIAAGGTVGRVRNLLGPAAACLALYDDPELVRDIVEWHLRTVREHVFPLISRLKPEIVALWEDICGNHGLMVSPTHFEQFGGGYYREVAAFAGSEGVPVVAVDCDGNVGELAPLLASFGVNCLYPFEAKGNHDLFALRDLLPDFILMGWLEKETINEGNEEAIEPEIRRKVPGLLAKGGYFPNGDHGLQPLATFPNLCRFMTLLHEVCGNPEGEFPRV